jgi:hypothetical protein
MELVILMGHYIANRMSLRIGCRFPLVRANQVLTQALVIIMIGSQVGLSLAEAYQHNWRVAAVSALVAAANALVFWK